MTTATTARKAIEKMDRAETLRLALEADPAARADFDTLLDICTAVLVAGHGTEALLAECKPYLIALHRCGIDPVAAVESAKTSAIIRAMHITEGGE